MTNNLHKAKIKELRADARKLVVVAKHLREEARSLATEERAEKARVNFYSRPAKVDSSVILTPDIPEGEKELIFP